jgi:hypothetical protein
MGLLSKLSGQEVKAFADQLAESLVRDLPPKLILSGANVISANRVTTILERSYGKAAAYQGQHRIGFFGRATFANAFRWKMAELGYPDEFINVATQGLLVHLSKNKRSAAA